MSKYHNYLGIYTFRTWDITLFFSTLDYSPIAQRGLFFDPKYSTTKMGNKESPSPPDVKRQQLQNLTPPQVPNVPFMSSLFSSLPFSPAVFPPLIDMSSTQALVTLVCWNFRKCVVYIFSINIIIIIFI